MRHDSSTKSAHDNWDEHWSRYAVATAQNPAQRMRYALAEKLFAARTDARTPRVLDIGSGQGDLLQRLSNSFPQAELLGFEMSETGVEISRKKVSGAKFLVVDLYKPTAEADICVNWATDAICSEVLEHLDSPQLFLTNARRFLATDARLIVTVPGGPMSAFDRHIGHRQHFTRRSISSLLEAAGFVVDRTYLSGFPFFNLYRCVVIARGDRLAEDVAVGYQGKSSYLAGIVMTMFRGLFRFNMFNSPFGWQVVAVARKSGS